MQVSDSFNLRGAVHWRHAGVIPQTTTQIPSCVCCWHWDKHQVHVKVHLDILWDREISLFVLGLCIFTEIVKIRIWHLTEWASLWCLWGGFDLMKYPVWQVTLWLSETTRPLPDRRPHISLAAFCDGPAPSCFSVWLSLSSFSQVPACLLGLTKATTR